MKTAECHNWNAWHVTSTQWLLSHENTEHLSVWSSVDDLINYLWFKDKEAARVLNKRLKENN